jgi:hypothetical protein
VRELLLHPNTDNLTQIMFLHFKFARNFARNLENYISVDYYYDNDDDEFGSSRDIDQLYMDMEKTYANFYAGRPSVADARRADVTSERISRYSNDKMYESEYYRERGRSDIFHDEDEDWTGILGISTINSTATYFNRGLELNYNRRTQWISDSKSQEPDFFSTYTNSLINNDTPYVAGPSGMTSLFVPQMLALTEKDPSFDQTMRREYLAAVTAYMVSAGFHSLHEVLGPVRHCLHDNELLPEEYVSAIPTRDDIGQPANYHVFYQMMMDIDPEFAELMENGYTKLNAFMEEYCVDYDNAFLFEKLRMLRKRFTQSINAYIDDKTVGNVMFRLMPSLSKGIKRAKNYLSMLQDASTSLQQMIIMYSLVVNPGASGLKQHVLNGGLKHDINFEDESEIRQELEELITHMAGEDVMARIQEAVKTDFIPIMNANPSRRRCYQSAMNKGDFADVLERLEHISDPVEVPQLEVTKNTLSKG